MRRANKEDRMRRVGSGGSEFAGVIGGIELAADDEGDEEETDAADVCTLAKGGSSGDNDAAGKHGDEDGGDDEGSGECDLESTREWALDLATLDLAGKPRGNEVLRGAAGATRSVSSALVVGRKPTAELWRAGGQLATRGPAVVDNGRTNGVSRSAEVKNERRRRCERKSGSV